MKHYKVAQITPNITGGNTYYEGARQVIQAIGEGYMVGGFVRDLLIANVLNGEPLDKPGLDIDIVTHLDYEEVKQKLEASNLDLRFKEQGQHFSVIGVTLRINGKNYNYDVAQTRIDGAYSDGRHPDTVETGVSYYDDVMRRDFTINTLMMDTSGNVYDLLGYAYGDLMTECIRAVGDPFERFTEDYLRIMRAMRFSSELGFEIEQTTLLAMGLLQAEVTRYVNPSRVYMELVRFMEGLYVVKALLGLSKSRVLNLIGPRLYEAVDFDQESDYHALSLFDHMLVTMDTVVKAGDTTFRGRYAALLHDIGKLDFKEYNRDPEYYISHEEIGKESVETFLSAYTIKKKDLDFILNAIKYHGIRMNKLKLTTLTKYFGNLDNVYQFLGIMHADYIAHFAGKDTQPNEGLLKSGKYLEAAYTQVAIERQAEQLDLKQFGVDGNVVQSYGYTPRGTGKVLKSLARQIVKGQVAPNKEAVHAELYKNSPVRRQEALERR